MITITQTVEIPANRRLVIEIPQEIPEGMAQVELTIVPQEKPAPSTEQAMASEGSPLEPPLKCLIGVETPLTDSLLGVVANPENKTYDELRFEGILEKYGEYLK